MSTKKDAKVVKEIIERYGEILDLKSSPYLIVEIIRQYGSKLSGPAAADCLPPGGPPPKKFNPGQLVRELKARLADISRLSDMLEEATNSKAKRATTKPSTK